ncbi:MAG: DUF4838 domain-containing protein, partial [Candidatus Micrarchaeota archaeon]
AAGVKLPVVKESELKAGTPAIYLGRTQAAGKAGLPLRELKGWTFLKMARNGNLFLAGSDTGPIPALPNIEYLGTLKAVTSFLEDEAGVRFVLPGTNGVAIPKIERLEVPAGLNVLSRPNFTYVIGRRANDIVYSVANNFYYSACPLKSYGGHSYYDAVPKATYAKDHPEYFALKNGVRQPAADHLCISNPDVQKLMIDEMCKRLDAGYEWVELAQTDGYQPCECEKCMAIHPDIGEQLWIVHRKLAKQMRQLRPGKKIMIISYGPTLKPPVTFKSFPDNVVIQMCHYDPKAFEEWQPLNVEKTVYVYNWGCYWTLGFGPKRTPRYAAEQIRIFVDNKVQGIYLCGAFENLGLEGPVYYVYGKAMGNPQLNVADTLNDYYREAFGKAHSPMKAFFDGMYERLEFFSAFNRPNYRMDMENYKTFTTPEDAYCHFFPPTLLADMENNLAQARTMEDDPRVQARLRLIETDFAYVKNLARIFHLYRAYRCNPSWETFGHLAEEIEKRNALIDARYDDKGAIKYFDGWPTLWGGAKKEYLKKGGNMHAILSAPVNWNTKLLKEKNMLPGVGKKSLRVSRVDGIKFDGNIDDPAWQKVKAEEFLEIGMGELKDGTFFKMAYDAKYLYFAFDCAMTDADKLNVIPRGRDGNCWAAECIEILLDPFGTRAKYYHFIFNPVPSSCYDSRYGYIQDPLDPRYTKGEVDWNGEWEYIPVIEKEKKRWTAEVRIPFSTLGIEAPKPGSKWCMNIGREEYDPTGKDRDKLDLSLWSPNLEERSFHSRTTFGDVFFE